MLIVYVDDDEDDREMFSEAVKAIDHQISCSLFESGPELLEFLGKNVILPDYIFIDINMPRMNGYECAREIKSNKHLKQVQVVMLSTAFNPNDQKEFSNLGIKFLTKATEFSVRMQSIKSIIKT